jgi:integrase
MTARRRRPPGEGSVFEYQTAAGVTRYGIKFDGPSADGKRRQVMRRRDANRQPWLDRDVAVDALREAVVKAGKGDWIEPSKQPVAAYLATWLDGLRLAPSTMASYRKNVRLHVVPYIGALPLASLTSKRLTALYNELEASGRRGQKGERTGLPLAPRTVRYISTILGAAFGAAVDDEMPLLECNPNAKAKPPTAKEAKAPEMHPWTSGQLRAFLDWAHGNSELYALWYMLAYTGMRRGELLALRWRDVDLDAATVGIRRSVGVIKIKGQPNEVREGDTKTCKPRVIDIEPATVAVLRAWKAARLDGAPARAPRCPRVRQSRGRVPAPGDVLQDVQEDARPLREGSRRRRAGDPASRSPPYARDDPANGKNCIWCIIPQSA